MKNSCLAIAFITVALFGSTTHALERDASMIDTIGVVGGTAGEEELLSVTLWGETAMRQAPDWAFLLGGQYGSVSPLRLSDINQYWSFGIGLKWYMLPVTSISLTGEYGQYGDLDGTPSVYTGSATIKQRLLPSDTPLSPFVAATLALRSSDDVIDLEGDDFSIHEGKDGEVVLTLSGGCDFSMTDDMVIVLEAAYTEAEQLESGWLLSLGMKYYWD